MQREGSSGVIAFNKLHLSSVKFDVYSAAMFWLKNAAVLNKFDTEKPQIQVLFFPKDVFLKRF